MTEQTFLITVSRMCTSDEADVVVDWSAVVEEKDLDKAGEIIQKVAAATALILKDFPGTNTRPMTLEEIRAWREERDESEEIEEIEEAAGQED